jgi:hypothetical protein
MVHQP